MRRIANLYACYVWITLAWWLVDWTFGTHSVTAFC
jgi:hypothetical protein